MITKATADLPEIDWIDQHTLLSNDIDEREEVYHAEGIGTNGKYYIGIATFSCDELIEITEIYEL